MDDCFYCGNAKRLRCPECEPSYKTAWERMKKFCGSEEFLANYPSGKIDGGEIVGIMAYFEADMKA